MNKWVRKSIILANSRGYLDKLSKVYPVEPTPKRRLTRVEKNKIINAFNRRKYKELIQILLDLKRFPIDDPYVGFLRKNRKAINQNPVTVRRIIRQLKALKLGGILAGATRPKSPSRQFGQMFTKWLSRHYKKLSASKFLKYKTGIALLEGGDATLGKFARKELGYHRKKGLDIVLRKKNVFIIGEAKLITTSGGTQDKSFRELMSFVKSRNNKAFQVAILDGVVWLKPTKTKTKKKKPTLYEGVSRLNQNQIAISALLLKDFIKSL